MAPILLPLKKAFLSSKNILQALIQALSILSSSGPGPIPGPRSGQGPVQVRSQSGPDLDLDKIPGPRLTLNLVSIQDDISDDSQDDIHDDTQDDIHDDTQDDI